MFRMPGNGESTPEPVERPDLLRRLGREGSQQRRTSIEKRAPVARMLHNNGRLVQLFQDSFRRKQLKFDFRLFAPSHSNSSRARIVHDWLPRVQRYLPRKRRVKLGEDGLGALGEIRTPLLTYSRIGSFSLQFGPRDKSRAGGRDALDLLDALRQDSKVSGTKCHLCLGPLTIHFSITIAKGPPVGGPLFAGNRYRVATRKIPTFVLRIPLSSSEKTPKGRFEHRWFAEQPLQQGRRRAGHSNPVLVQLDQRAISI